jgi:hypothetical protein
MSLLKALFAALFTLGLTLVITFVVDIMGKEPLLGIPAGVVLIAGVLLTAVGLVGYDSVTIRNAQKAWRQLAAQTGLTFKSKGFGHVYGTTCRGRQVHIYARSSTTSLSDRLSDVETIIRVALKRPVEERFMIHIEKSGASLARSGVEALEEIVSTAGQQNSYYVTGQRNLYTRAVLASPELRRQLVDLREHSTIGIRDSLMILRQSDRYGMERDISYLLSVLDVLSDLAEAIETADEF